MNKAELVSYCANLLSIMAARETTGIARGQTLGREYTRAYDELTGIIRKEEENETRKRSNDVRTETTTSGRQDQRPSS